MASVACAVCVDDTINKRTSSWPVRTQRRHEATLAFNSEVLSTLAQIVNRLDKIERIMEAKCPLAEEALPPPSQKLDALSHNPHASRVTHQEGMGDCLSVHGGADDMTTRIDRLELLLFKMPMQDFTELDEKIKKLMPRSESRSILAHTTTCIPQPEIEQSPEKQHPQKAERSYPQASRCLHFDIHSEPELEEEKLAGADRLDAVCKEEDITTETISLDGDWRSLPKDSWDALHNKFLDAKQRLLVEHIMHKMEALFNT